MTPEPEKELVFKNVASARRTAWIAVMIFVALILSGGLFAAGTIRAQYEHEVLSHKALNVATSAQREINGNQAMIFAVCKAFRRRDVSSANKWKSVTRIERQFERPGKNPLDAKYRKALHKALTNAANADATILGFDCLRGMERAYTEGARSSSALESLRTSFHHSDTRKR